MQISRLFEIVYILLDKKSITAGELAERFEVSVRTIYRDIESLSVAGIPIYAERGKNGGIRLMDNYILNKSVLSEQEKKEILAALNGLVQTRVADYSALNKLTSFFGTQSADESNWVSIDFSDWSGKKQAFLELLKTSILNCQVLTFSYYNSSGVQSDRTVYPVQLWFKARTWYLKAFCLDKKAYRTFRLTRIRNVGTTGETFHREELSMKADLAAIQADKKEIADTGIAGYSEQIQGASVAFELWVQREMAYRVYDEFEEEEIRELENGDFLINGYYPMDNWVYGMILSFGDKAKVIRPDFLREEISAIGERIRERNLKSHMEDKS
ncbi:YafY family protein [Anaerocolumna sp. AGMB13020]|uniref:helix-turn-helix transcriptional regulator n=1 Tax=Anaerocolumna sp. AGMB13020 TaxID=3081750 RepID=UPI00295425C2|nr:YafY family protein [Anaerocolumna sp. AGMB13020]WOO36792.1 YafY family protein [Anaerocolumna sp. AGMB13020]